MNTLVSMSIKNQWGCIQEPSERLKLHPYFAETMFEFNRRLPRTFSIIDGRYGLNRTGPMLGDVIDFNFGLGANDLVAADRVCCRIMQIDEARVGYLRYFKARVWWTPFAEIRVNEDIPAAPASIAHSSRGSATTRHSPVSRTGGSTFFASLFTNTTRRRRSCPGKTGPKAGHEHS